MNPILNVFLLFQMDVPSFHLSQGGIPIITKDAKSTNQTALLFPHAKMFNWYVEVLCDGDLSMHSTLGKVEREERERKKILLFAALTPLILKRFKVNHIVNHI